MWSIAKIASEFNEDVARLVASVTKRQRRPGEDKHQYEAEVFAQVRAGGIRAIIIKLADRLHNVLTPWGSVSKQENKIRETLRYVLPLAVEVGVLWKEITIVCGSTLYNQQAKLI